MTEERDVKALADAASTAPASAAIQAPWGEDAALRDAVRALRDAGEIVVAVLPGHAVDAAAYTCDRELVQERGRWVVRAAAAADPIP